MVKKSAVVNKEEKPSEFIIKVPIKGEIKEMMEKLGPTLNVGITIIEGTEHVLFCS